MIPAPPGMTAIINGISYALGLATRRAAPEALARASVWDALWFQFLLVFATGMLALGTDGLRLMPLLAMIVLVGTLAYPVVSHFILGLAELEARWRVFILAVTWVSNLKLLLAMILVLVFGPPTIGNPDPNDIPLVVVMLWMLWATWSAASRSLGNRALAGVGMVMLMMLLDFAGWIAQLVFIAPRMQFS